MVIPNSDVSFLPPTESSGSEISCMTVVARRFPDPTVPKRNPRGCRGAAAHGRTRPVRPHVDVTYRANTEPVAELASFLVGAVERGRSA